MDNLQTDDNSQNQFLDSQSPLPQPQDTSKTKPLMPIIIGVICIVVSLGIISFFVYSYVSNMNQAPADGYGSEDIKGERVSLGNHSFIIDNNKWSADIFEYSHRADLTKRDGSIYAVIEDGAVVGGEEVELSEQDLGNLLMPYLSSGSNFKKHSLEVGGVACLVYDLTSNAFGQNTPIRGALCTINDGSKIIVSLIALDGNNGNMDQYFSEIISIVKTAKKQ